jgi:hypothetical protein
MTGTRRVPAWGYAIAAAAIVGVTAGIELAMGRVPWCKCGYIKLWHGVVQSSENSQHLTDWYSSRTSSTACCSAWCCGSAKRVPVGARFVMAVLLEAAWEVLENTPMVINHYRAATISLDYCGDSVISSISDIAAMMADSGSRAACPCGRAWR